MLRQIRRNKCTYRFIFLISSSLLGLCYEPHHAQAWVLCSPLLHLSYHSLVTQVLLLNILLLLVEEALISQRAVTVAFIFLSLDLAHEVCAPYVFVD